MALRRSGVRLPLSPPVWKARLAQWNQGCDALSAFLGWDAEGQCGTGWNKAAVPTKLPTRMGIDRRLAAVAWFMRLLRKYLFYQVTLKCFWCWRKITDDICPFDMALTAARQGRSRESCGSSSLPFDDVGSGEEGIGGYNLVCDINFVEENSIEDCDLQNWIYVDL